METKNVGSISFLLAGICLLLSASVLRAQGQKGFVSFPVSFKGYSVDKDSEQFMQVYFCAWRSIEGKWKYLGLRGKLEDNKDECDDIKPKIELDKARSDRRLTTLVDLQLLRTRTRWPQESPQEEIDQNEEHADQEEQQQVAGNFSWSRHAVCATG